MPWMIDYEPFSKLKLKMEVIDMSKQISFKGIQCVERLADRQNGADCWLEALENIIQLDNQDYGNGLSDKLRKAMIEGNYPGYIRERDNLDDSTVRYPEILNRFGIETDWYIFSHELLIKSIQENRGILARGQVKHLSRYNQDAGYHAFVITDAKRDIKMVAGCIMD